MVRLLNHLSCRRNKSICLGLQYGSTPSFHVLGASAQALKEPVDVLADFGLCAQTGVGRHLISNPVPNGLVSIEIRTVAGQSNQPQLEVRGGKVGSQGFATMSRSVVPDDDQRLGMTCAQVAQEVCRCLGIAVALHFHLLYLAALQADCRVVVHLLLETRAGRIHQRWFSFQNPLGAQVSIGSEVGLVNEEYLRSTRLSLLTQLTVVGNEGLALSLISFDQPLLRTLEDEPQPVQVVQATASAQPHSKALCHEGPHRLPVPVRRCDSTLAWWPLHCRLQLGLLPSAEGGGEPPVCSKLRPSGPLSRKAATHLPMVWASRSRALATCPDDQPRANSHSACQRSRSRGVGARYIRSRTSPSSNCHCSRSVTMLFMVNPRHLFASPDS